tara:strand:- start:614 stop:1084 length:471 start_codon:yes stop_codon:yes gene_type:complete
LNDNNFLLKGDINYYKILGVHEKASNNELRKAFCKLSIELHPDTTSLDLEEAKYKFQEVLEAYENLNNTYLRQIYDKKLKERTETKIVESNLNNINPYGFDTKNQYLIGNRRPFSNGEMFSLFLLIVIIVFCLFLAIIFASFTGKEIDSMPIWLVR